MAKLEQLMFDNTYARLPDTFYERIAPTPFERPHLVHFNPEGAALIELDVDEAKRPEFVEYWCGKRCLPGSDPIAMLYAGHQFGIYVPQLGDGRAILLGEVRTSRGEKWDLHLKGAGLTRFSRDGDGRAVLRSTIREYLCGEALHGLGIPTTRSLCIIGSDEPVIRETVETGAMLVRLAPSHVRFGTFEVFYYRRQYEHLRLLADYVITHHFPHLARDPDRYVCLLYEVAERTGRLIAKWQAVGWAHGVMNTDNMSILGLTLDYGPFGFMDAFQPSFIPNHSDHHGRYAFQNQPDIGYWNIRAIAQALSPLMNPAEAHQAPEVYETAFSSHYAELMQAKLGLREVHEGDERLRRDLLAILHSNKVDYTLFFRALADFRQDDPQANEPLRAMFSDKSAFDWWAERYRARLKAERSVDTERKIGMHQCNPKYVLRTYLAHQAIQRARVQDYSELDRLLQLLRHPFDEQPEMDAYAAPPPEWAQHLVVSCSS
ncbi:MAG: YdiU family protein [Nitrospirae bacterium]|nr:MAG: YdiU family protein [Nitrospirota bacterium]